MYIGLSSILKQKAVSGPGVVNDTCITKCITTHSSVLPLSILLLFTATQLRDGIRFHRVKKKFLPCRNYYTLVQTCSDGDKRDGLSGSV